MPTPISLVTTVYNRERYLAQTLDSILDQTYPHFEVLIWDDGSTDRSVEIAQQYARQDPRVRVIASPINQGFPTSIKAAISATTDPYFGWVDSDDLLAPTALAETVAILNARTSVGLVYTNHLLIDEAGHDRGLGRQCRIPYSRDRLLVDFMIFHFRLIRRSVYEQVGGIDSTIACAEDYDLCLKLSEVTEIHHLPKPLYYYRRHSNNVTNNQVEVIRSAYQAISNALHRRGLNSQYQLKVTPTFSLRPTSAGAALPTPPIQFTAPPSLEPLVSIIIPAYNAASRLHLCLQSCIHQTYPNLEIIVVNNNSTDDTARIANSIARSTARSIQTVCCMQPGANAARNFGFAHAQGDYIQWLDADDDLAPDKIMKQVIALVQQPEVDIAYGDWDWCFWQERQLLAQLRFVDRVYDDFVLQTLMDNWRPPHAYLLRRRAAIRLHQMQAWNPDTTVYMDREYFTVAALLGLPFLYVPNSFVRYHRWSSTQVSRRATYSDRVDNRRRIFRRFQDIAQVCRAEHLTPSHQFLLRQNWELWQPAFTLIQPHDRTVALQHTLTSELLPLTSSEANIARALLSAARPRTLEDHARKIIQVLWLEILLELSGGAASTLDFDQITDTLSRRVGRSESLDAANLDVDSALQSSSVDRSAELNALDPLLQEVPLFTPLLGEERLVVQQFLERLRQGNWLQSVASAA